MSERRPDDGPSYPATLVVLGCIVVGGIGFTVITLRGASPEEGIERWRIVLGASLIIWSAAFLAFYLLSWWAYGSLRTLRASRQDAIIVRSGSSPAFRRVLESNRPVRQALSRTRPPFMQFVLVIDARGIEIWHGAGRGQLTGSLERALIDRVSVGRTHDGVWPFTTIEVQVASSDGPQNIPFVVRGRSGFIGAKASDVQRIVSSVQEIYARQA